LKWKAIIAVISKKIDPGMKNHAQNVIESQKALVEKSEKTGLAAWQRKDTPYG
jgi:hypothetical protein